MKKSTQHTTIPYILFKVSPRTTISTICSAAGTGRNRTEREGNNPVKQRGDHRIEHHIMLKTLMAQEFTNYRGPFAHIKKHIPLLRLFLSFKEKCEKLTLTLWIWVFIIGFPYIRTRYMQANGCLCVIVKGER